MIGRRIGEYVIERELGRGGMGVVYEAWDERLQRRVALKAVLPDRGADPAMRARVEREARAAARLSHPYVAQVFAVVEDAGQPWIVMERLEGETLAARLGRGALPAAEALTIGADVADALTEAHRQGVVHRDLKPSNIFLTRNAHVKVMDFGLARILESAPASEEAPTRTALARTGAVLAGTPGYLSPEQARGLTVGPASDVFALAIVVTEMLTGTNPFAAGHLMESLYRLFQTDVVANLSFGGEVPATVATALRSALGADPASRPTAAQLERVLRDALRTPGFDPVAVPETRYAESSGARVAYQVVGAGSLDLIYVAGWISNVELSWENPGFVTLVRGLQRHGRVLLFDKRGTGLSDRVRDERLPTLEQRMDDMRAVMDAVGSRRALLFGVSEGGPMSILFAATYPDRVAGLIGLGTYAARIPTPDYPWAPDPAAREKWLDALENEWGTNTDLSESAPSLANDEAAVRWWARYRRQSCSPRAAVALGRMNTEADVRQILPLVRVPTLILHRIGDRNVAIGGARYLAARIPGARMIELAGDDHLPWVNPEQILEAMEPFIREIAGRPEAAASAKVATVLHATLPANGVRQRAPEIDALVTAFRGRRVSAPDQRLIASFDGPGRALRCAQALRAEFVAGVASGVHTGECHMAGEEIHGVAVEVAAALAAEARPGEILASRAVHHLVAGSGIVFDASPVMVRDESGKEWSCFEVRG